MKYREEKQFIIFVDYEPFVRQGNFGIYVVDRVNKVYFKISQKYTVDCVKNIKELIKLYEIERIEMYTLHESLHWLKSELEVCIKTPIGLAYDVRAYRDQLRRERNPIRNKTQPGYYYEHALRYEFISVHAYTSKDYKKGIFKQWVIYFGLSVD